MFSSVSPIPESDDGRENRRSNRARTAASKDKEALFQALLASAQRSRYISELTQRGIPHTNLLENGLLVSDAGFDLARDIVESRLDRSQRQAEPFLREPPSSQEKLTSADRGDAGHEAQAALGS